MARSVRPYRAPHSFKVVALQGHPVSADVPDVGDTLVWDGTEWVPTPMPSRVRSNDPTAFGETLNLQTTVIGLQGYPIFSGPPNPGDGLLWDGGNWRGYPVGLNGPFMPAGGGGGEFLPLTGGVLSNPGALTVGDILTVEGADSTNGVSLIDMPGLSGAVQTEGNGLLLQQLGDQYGLTSLLIANRDGLNGAMFTNEGLNLVDFAFQTSEGVTGTLRLDARTIPTGQFLFMLSGNTLFTIDSAGNTVGTGTLTRPGVVDGSNAAAGVVGEFLTASNINSVLLTSGAVTAVTQISLTPGDWDVSGNVVFGFENSGTFTGVSVGLNTVNNAMPGTPFIGVDGSMQLFAGTFASLDAPTLAVGPKRYNVSATTIVYMVVQIFLAGGGDPVTNGATIRARRVR